MRMTSWRGVVVASSLEGALARPADVLVDFTSPGSVKQRTLEALAAGVRVVIGTSGLAAADYAEIERAAAANRLGVIAAGNFSLTAALAKHFPSWRRSTCRPGRSSTTPTPRSQTHPAARPANWRKHWRKSPGTN